MLRFCHGIGLIILCYGGAFLLAFYIFGWPQDCTGDCNSFGKSMFGFVFGGLFFLIMDIATYKKFTKND